MRDQYVEKVIAYECFDNTHDSERGCHRIPETASSKTPAVMKISGEIVTGDFNYFIRLAVPELANPGAIVHVVLNSPGGLLYDGLRIGYKLRALGYHTVVDGNCVSVCALIWLSGTVRVMHAGATIGFHAISTIRGGDTCSIASSGNAAVGAYLTYLGYSLPAVAYATEAAPNSMNWLSFEKAKELKIPIWVFDRDRNSVLEIK